MQLLLLPTFGVQQRINAERGHEDDSGEQMRRDVVCKLITLVHQNVMQNNGMLDTKKASQKPCQINKPGVFKMLKGSKVDQNCTRIWYTSLGLPIFQDWEVTVPGLSSTIPVVPEKLVHIRPTK